MLRRIELLPQSAQRWLRLEGEIRRTKVTQHPYVVVYAVLPDQLVVLAIAHTSKAPGYWHRWRRRLLSIPTVSAPIGLMVTSAGGRRAVGAPFGKRSEWPARAQLETGAP